MRYLSSAAAVALLASSAAARPNHLRPRETEPPVATAAPTDANLQPWVTVGENGKPSTVTPVQTTISGTPTVVSAPPNDLTATVFTSYSEAAAHTRTGSVPAAPTATGANGQGSFLKCNKPKGEPFAPFCAPLPWDQQEYRPGNTYYFTWDATWFKSAPNTTIQITGSYINESSNGATTETEAFKSDGVVASWGYWSWYADRKILLGQHALNISVSMASLKPGGDAKGANLIQGPKILLSEAPVPKPKPVPAPAGPALYIGLPVILGFALLCIFGVCIWNARHRRIELGNIMSRGRHGYGINKSARGRMGLGPSKSKKAAERVQLMERELAADGAAVYRDHDDHTHQQVQNNFPPLEHPGRPRRDSDALGSLAGTPTENRQMTFPNATGDHEGRPNAFRDELKRQDGERF